MNQYVRKSICISVHISVIQYVCLTVYLTIFQSMCKSVCLSVRLYVSISINPSVFESLCRGVGQYVSRIVYQYLCLFVLYPSIWQTIYLCFSLQICQSVSQRETQIQSVCLSIHQCVRLSFCLSCYQLVFLYVGLCVIYYCNMFYCTILLKCYIVICILYCMVLNYVLIYCSIL